ncbi:MAG TPA: hypothetical protein VMP89_09715 [Solirubrobacteraceae bacterium]|nr:hypothetical protein [Solirubrobacteraceae bacterium]
MPEIIVTAAGSPDAERGHDDVLLRERVSAADFESERFAANLVERIEWAVGDATEVERRGRITGRVMPPRRPAPEKLPEPAPEPVGSA